MHLYNTKIVFCNDYEARKFRKKYLMRSKKRDTWEMKSRKKNLNFRNIISCIIIITIMAFLEKYL